MDAAHSEHRDARRRPHACRGRGRDRPPRRRPRRRRAVMERWHALGNVYLLTTAELTEEDVRALVGDADGIVQVVASGPDWADVVVWNPDGSTAEIEQDLGPVEVAEPEEIEGLHVTRVSVGNPHAVVIADPADIVRIGPLL